MLGLSRLATPKTITAEAEVTLRHRAIELWPFIADANRMDRAVGLPPAEFIRTPKPEGGELVIGEYRRMGILVSRWREHPFEWQRPHRYSVVREYDFGPARRFYGGAELTETAEGTSVRVFIELEPRSRLYSPILSLWLVPRAIRLACEQYQAIGEFLDGQALDPFPTIAAEPRDVHAERIEACALRLSKSGVSPIVLDHLKRVVEEGGDETVAGMRPLELAKVWGTDPVETMQTFLQATVEGLLEMRWEFLCPSCRGVKADAAKLRDLEVTGYCAACNLPFAASLDEGIEARFYPTDAVRFRRVGTYCIGNPMNTPHRVAQTTLRPNERRIWQLSFDRGPFVLRSPQSKDTCRVTVSGDGSDHSLVDLRISEQEMSPSVLEVPSGDVELTLENLREVDVTVALDDAHWSDTAITPSRMMMAPGYNTLFSGDALAPGVELSVSRVGLLFSDLAGSTAMYERAGDAMAFRVVSEHFTVLESAITEAGGAVVKTIGDAVMGAFPDGVDALAAALDAQRRMRDFDTHGLADPTQLLKIGVHVGPAYLVTLNDRLDYFGTSVNIAARAQREAEGGEVVATSDIIEDASHLLGDEHLVQTPFDVYLKGIREPVQLTRIQCQPQEVATRRTGPSSTISHDA